MTSIVIDIMVDYIESRLDVSVLNYLAPNIFKQIVILILHIMTMVFKKFDKYSMAFSNIWLIINELCLVAIKVY